MNMLEDVLVIGRLSAMQDNNKDAHIYLVNGVKLSGKIAAYSDTALIIHSIRGECIVMWQAVSTIQFDNDEQNRKVVPAASIAMVRA